jgi:EKC/KEOPS complex subunit CGI121/TPRKB
MAKVRTVRFPHFEATPVQFALFKNVTNAAFLRTQLLEANPSFDYAFLDATMIFSPLTLFLATTISLQAYQTAHLKTRTPHSELVFRLHPNNNIGEAYRKFGISDTTSCLIAVKFSLTDEVTRESVERHLTEAVEGEAVEIGEGGEGLGMWTDVAKIKKVYKLNDGGKAKKGAKSAVNGEGKDETMQMEDAIMGIITLKGS